jgi:hypothetical protein
MTTILIRSQIFRKCQSPKNRKIDALLLSIGGNDVGFANMIANSVLTVSKTGVLRGGRPWAYAIWRYAAGPQTFSQGRAKAQSLEKRYADLSKKLQEYLDVPSDRIILSAYPDVNTNQSAETCPSGNAGMDVHAALNMTQEASKDASNFVKYLHGVMKDQAAKQGWHFADQHLRDGSPNNFAKDNQGKGHGICAAGPAGNIKASLQFPRPVLGQAEPLVWKPFYPENWTPYSERVRWIVTPNDAFLTTNYLDPHQPMYDIVQPLYAATLGGSFHPNALGHAALADSVLVELTPVLSAR